jgi:glucose/arabinose dehydrogenase
MSYPSTGHWTRSLIVSPDQTHLYVTVGSASNVDVEYPPRAAALIAEIDGSNQETFASGLRNAVGIDFHPKTGDLYVAVQERDAIGDDLVPDFFTRIQKDEFYGWPFGNTLIVKMEFIFRFLLAYLSSENVDPRRRFPNGTSERPDLVASTLTPDVLFESHSAVLGMQFYRGTQFPSQYQNGAFAAFHGSWNRHTGTGYKIVFIPFGDDNRPKGYYEEFVKGFLIDPQGPTTWGRPVGILEMKDGSLLVSDDGRGRLYRIEYVNSISPRQVTATTKAPSLVNSATPITIHIGLFICLIFSLLR